MAKEPEDKENEEVEKKSAPSTMKIVIVAVLFAVLLSGGLVGATFYFVSSMNAEQSSAAKDGEATDGDEVADEEESEPLAPPQYLSLDPKFVVSFQNQKNARFMQFSLEVMSRDGQAIEDIKTHMPVIRSSLLMLFGSQEYEAIASREGKEQLLMEATKDINAVLQKIAGKTELETVVEAAYFNSFVIQ